MKNFTTRQNVSKFFLTRTDIEIKVLQRSQILSWKFSLRSEFKNISLSDKTDFEEFFFSKIWFWFAKFSEKIEFGTKLYIHKIKFLLNWLVKNKIIGFSCVFKQEDFEANSFKKKSDSEKKIFGEKIDFESIFFVGSHISNWKFNMVSCFQLGFFRLVRFWNKFFTTCSILNWKLSVPSDFDWKEHLSLFEVLT